MPVMLIGPMHMAVGHWFMSVLMCMRSMLPIRMNVLMVHVKLMRVSVDEVFMSMHMTMMLGDHHPNTEEHEESCSHQRPGDDLSQEQDGNHRPDERPEAEEGARSR